MSKFKTDQKLELIHAIRMQNQYDRQTLRRREGILYDNPVNTRQGEIYGLEEAILPPVSGKYTGKMYVTDPERKQGNTSAGSWTGFRIRLALVMILFLGFVYCDVKQVSLAGKTGEQILEMLQENHLK